MIDRTALALLWLMASSGFATAFAGDLGQADIARQIDVLAQSTTAAQARPQATALKEQFALAGSVPAPTQDLLPFVTGGSPVVEMVDMRLLLAHIAVQTGAKDHLILTRAQTTDPAQVILLRGGFVTWDGLQALIEKTPAADFVAREGDSLRLTRPLVIWGDAGLTLGPGDDAILDAAEGSFIANLGWLDMRGASLRGSDMANKGEPAFRPFVLTAGRGSLTISGASFAHLGFGETQRFGGVSVVKAGLQPALTPPVVQDSQFTDVSALALINTTGARVQGNRMTDGTVLIARSSRGVVADNLMTPSDGQALRVLAGSSQMMLRDNIVLGGEVGISVEAAGPGVTVIGNILTGQSQSGLRLVQTDCVTVTGNLLVLGAGHGIAISDTGHIAIERNVILGNAGAGIFLRGQDPSAHVRISGNQIAANREGLRGATAGRISLSGNDMEGQMPRLFGGDMAFRTIGWLEARRDLGHPTLLQTDIRPICPTEGNP